MGLWGMYRFIWTSTFGIQTLTWSSTYTTSTRAMNLGVVFMQDFRSDPNGVKARNSLKSKILFPKLVGNGISSVLKNFQTHPDTWGASTLPQG